MISGIQNDVEKGRILVNLTYEQAEKQLIQLKIWMKVTAQQSSSSPFLSFSSVSLPNPNVSLIIYCRAQAPIDFPRPKTKFNPRTKRFDIRKQRIDCPSQINQPLPRASLYSRHALQKNLTAKLCPQRILKVDSYICKFEMEKISTQRDG